MADKGWIGTPALANGGTGHDKLQIVNAQITDGTITAAKLAAGASTAGNYGRRRLVESILLPSREIAPQYVTWSLVMDDGKLLTAVLVSERGENQFYADAAGKLIRLERKTIVDRKAQSISIMPDGLAAQLTDQELRDLLAFLSRRR